MLYKTFMERLLISFLLTLPVYLSTSAQTPYAFRHLSVDNGLSNNNVKAFLKDSEGFLWIGTDNGLNRYDGYKFKIFQPKDNNPNSLFSNDIWDLQEDAKGTLWIGTGSLYSIYNREKDNFINDIPKYLYNYGINVTGNYKVYVDKKRNLWVLEGKDIYYYNFKDKRLKSFKLDSIKDGINDSKISDDGKDVYLLINKNLLKLDSDTKSFQKINIQELPSRLLSETNVYVDNQKGIWLYSYNNELIYYKKNISLPWHQVKLYSKINTSSNAVRCIQDDLNGHVWICTDHRGVFVYDYVNDNLYNILNEPTSSISIASNRFNTVYRDDVGVIWLGNFKKGISYYHDSFNEFIDTRHKECGDIASIMEDSKGNVWMGTDGNGLYVSESKNSAVRKLQIPEVAIISLMEDRKGRIWAGSYQDGLFCIEGNKVIHYTKENSKLPYNSIWNIKEDRYGDLWIGSVTETLACFNPDKNTCNKYILPDGYGIHAVNMFYDHGDKLYIGTIYGLCIMDIVTKKPEMLYSNRKGTQKLKQLYISSIYKDDRDILWLAHKQGMSAWDLKNDSLYWFDVTNGLCDNLIKGIIEDNHRNMWFTTSNGVSILNIEQKNGELNFSFHNLSTRDGLPENYFNSYSVCKLSDGDLLFGGTNGYTFINPNKLYENSSPLTKLYFTNLTIGNKQIDVDSMFEGRKLLSKVLDKTETLTINYDDNLISIEFSAGDLINSDKIKYAYKLEGLNTQWYYTNENRVTFTTLPSGRYKLLIKACNSDGIWNEDVSELNIRVLPPWYLNTWSIILYIILTIGLITLLVLRTRRHHHYKLMLQKSKIEQEQKLLLNEMKIKFFTNISHDLRTPLTLILSPLQMLLGENLDEGVRKKLDTINKNAQQLLTLINSLLDFRKLDVGGESLCYKTGDMVSFIKEICSTFQEYAYDHSVHFSLMCEIDSLEMSFDPIKIKKVINNLLSNAFKYTDNNAEIIVHLYCEENEVCIGVADNGEGISDENKRHIFERFYQVSQTQDKTGSGIGLHIANEYVNLHNGTISITDNYPKGTVFTIKLPIITKTADKVFIKQGEISETDKRNVILLVDDNKDFCSFMSEYLSDEYAIKIAYNGEEAISILNKDDIDIVISDVMMPVMNGTELCKRIKTNVELSHIPVILLTARMAEESKNEGYKMGADDYIVKPFDFSMLKLRIKKFIEWKEKSHQNFSQKMEISPSEITITPLDELFIGKAIKIVEERMCDTDFSVEVLGSELGLSRSHLYKKLMVITGKGPADFIRIIRLKRSKQLLLNSQKQIAEIAYEVGFSSPKRFTINFKKEYGISPSEYIRSQK